MKHLKNFLGLLILGLLLVPNFVFAEDIPREGVTYFLVYPDNSETAVETYEEAMDMMENGEKLLYRGRTDENGQVPLVGWKNSGELRILQKVPNGYSTDYDEVKVDLSKGEAVFINYRGVNPNTGRSILLIALVIGGLGIATILLKSKNKKNALYVILPLVLLGITLQAKALIKESFIINVKDREGNKMANVEVLVYGKPIAIDAQPAVKIDANGGQFLDGETIMYVRIPHSPCTYNELMEYIQELPDYNEITMNINYATRENYMLADNPVEELDQYTHGMTLNLQWIEDDVPMVKLHGNGGYFPFRGKILTEVRVYGYKLHSIVNKFIHDEKENVGIDTTSSCEMPSFILEPSRAQGPGEDRLPEVGSSQELDYYECWEKDPRQLKVNGESFLDRPSNCIYFEGSDGSYVTFYGEDSNLVFYYDEQDFYYMLNSRVTNIMDKSPLAKRGGGNNSAFEIVKGNDVILSIENSEIEYTDDSYHITNEEKRNALKNIIQNNSSNCRTPSSK